MEEKNKKNKGSLFQVVSRRVGGVREGRCENDWGPDLGKAQAWCDVAFGCWASGRPGCQNDGLSAALEPSDATQEEAETDGRAGWLEPQRTSLPAHAPCNTPAECVPSWESVRWCEKSCIFTLLHRLEPQLFCQTCSKGSTVLLNIWVKMMISSSAAQPCLPLPHSVLFISCLPHSLCCYFLWQGKLSSQGFFKYLLFCLAQISPS